MMHSKLIVAALMLTGTTLLGPEQVPRREPTRTARRRAATPRTGGPTSRATFQGKRTLTNRKLSKSARAQLESPTAPPPPIAKPTKADFKAAIAMKGSVSAGPLPGTPSAASPSSGPAEFLYVPPAKLGTRTGPLGVEKTVHGTMRWSSAGMEIGYSQPITLRVAPPPPGKIAIVRCGVAVPESWAEPPFEIAQPGMIKHHPVGPAGGLLKFAVFPADADVLVKLTPMPPKTSERRRPWTLNGCDRAVY